MSELIALREELAASKQNDAFAVNVPTMNLGCMRWRQPKSHLRSRGTAN